MPVFPRADYKPRKSGINAQVPRGREPGGKTQDSAFGKKNLPTNPGGGFAGLRRLELHNRPEGFGSAGPELGYLFRSLREGGSLGRPTEAFRVRWLVIWTLIFFSKTTSMGWVVQSSTSFLRFVANVWKFVRRKPADVLDDGRWGTTMASTRGLLRGRCVAYAVTMARER